MDESRRVCRRDYATAPCQFSNQPTQKLAIGRPQSLASIPPQNPITSTATRARIVQNLSRNRSRGCAMIVAQHSTKSLAPFDCTVTFLNVSGGL
jgi:hypothetical protein